MDTEKLENQLILQCAPLIVGLRMAGLFIVSRKEVWRVYGLLRDSMLSYYVLCVGRERVIFLLFCRRRLSDYLMREKVRACLRECGYPDTHMEGMLRLCRQRYQCYQTGEAQFPHELGLFLGYPLADVCGFIRNHGKSSLYTGYWKVYEDVAYKRKLFRMFDLTRELLIELVNNGVDVREIIDAFRENEWGDSL